MTKKVLISLDELVAFMTWGYSISANELKEKVSPWFNSQPEAPQWISVEDRLPDIGLKVFAVGLGCVFQGSIDIDGYWVETESGELILNGATHWMPIPPLPESNEN